MIGHIREGKILCPEVVVQLPVDKRLLWLRQGGGLLPHSGWSSFNSDASNLTSGSSANRRPRHQTRRREELKSGVRKAAGGIRREVS
nr:hypothetical protein BaRGS_027736 [Batillaria attramentaria]